MENVNFLTVTHYSLLITHYSLLIAHYSTSARSLLSLGLNFINIANIVIVFNYLFKK